jgi:tetratricopeptide (TPR) repeat protein
MLRITTQLIDARADVHIWSETFDRTFDDIFLIQDEVAAEVANRLQMELGVERPKATEHHPVAYALYGQAWPKIVGSAEERREAEDLLRRALEIEPDYLDAKVGLAWIHDGRGNDALFAGDTALANQEYERAAQIAFDVESADPDNVQVHLWRAWANIRRIGDAVPHAEKALAIEPTHTDALNTAVVVLTRLWRTEEAIPVARYAWERDPLNTFVIWNLARAQFNAGEYEAAAETWRAFTTFNPDAVHAQSKIGLSILLQGRPEDALGHFRTAVADKALSLHGQVLALYDLGRIAEANAAFDQLQKDEASHAYLVGTAAAWIGNVDEAFAMFETVREETSGSIFRVEADSPLYANLRDDPRWLPFLASVELAPEYLASVEFNPRLPRELR